MTWKEAQKYTFKLAICPYVCNIVEGGIGMSKPVAEVLLFFSKGREVLSGIDLWS